MGRQIISGIFYFLLAVIVITVAAIMLNGKMINDATKKLKEKLNPKKEPEFAGGEIKTDGQKWSYAGQAFETFVEAKRAKKLAGEAKSHGENNQNVEETSHKE